VNGVSNRPNADVPLAPTFDNDSMRLRNTLDSLSEGVQILSHDWRYVYVNETVAAQGRKSPEELLGNTLFDCYPGIEDTAIFAELNRCMRERVASAIENEFEYENGDRCWFELRIHPCHEGLIVLSLDISERKRLEAALRQSQHLRALGQFAAGIAHDLKNFLTPISLQISTLGLQVGDDKEIQETLRHVNSVLKRGSETIETLQDFARQEPERGELEEVDLDDIVRHAQRLRSNVIEKDQLAFDVSLAASAPVRVKAAELLSSILNLLANAIDAMPDGGRLTLASGATDSEVWLDVRDTGCGMNEEVRQRAMEPFFSTKGRGNAGLGLAMVYAFATRNGGRLQLESEPGKGTSVRLSLPRADIVS
jgi:PAS domain S-box-containing protein